MKRSPTVAEKSLLEAVSESLAAALAGDERVILLGQDLGRLGGVFRATVGLEEKFGPRRVVEAPLAGAATIGVGIGAALYGMLPICEVQFADFIHPAFNQIVNQAARSYYRSNGAWPVPMVIRAPYGGGTGGGLYHSQSVEAFFAHVPGLKVVVPSTPYDAKGLLLAAVRDPNPVLFLEPKRVYRSLQGEVPAESYTVPLGLARVSREGSDLSLFAYGAAHQEALAAARAVEAEGIDAEVVDLRTLAPPDREGILASVRKTGKALIVHEDNLTGGYGAEVAAIIAEEAFQDLDAPVRRLAGPDVPAMPFNREMQAWFLVSREKIAAAIRDLYLY